MDENAEIVKESKNHTMNYLFFHKTNYLFLCLFLFIFSNTYAQELQRKGTFGIQMENMDDKSGLKVIKVIENTTASAIGLKADDIILSINEIAYSDVYELVDAIGTWRQGDAITAIVKRDNKKQTLNGKIVGKPLETSKYGKVIYGHVDYDGGKLMSILELPNGVKNPPVVMFLPGIGCGSLDFYYNENSTTKLWIEALVKKGIAVYRVDKPGMGDGEGTKDCSEMDFDYEINAFRTALQTLKKIESINNKQVFLYGHSLGVISAPYIAKDNDVAGIISWGGISTTWYEYSLKILRDQKVLQGQDYTSIEENFRKIQPFYYDFLIQQKTPKELTKNPDYQELVKHHFHNDMWHGLHHYTYFHTLNDKNILTAYKDANCPILALAGEYDIHAVSTDWAKELADAVNYYRPNTGTSLVIPKTTHHYHTVPSIPMYFEMRKSGELNAQYQAQHFSTDVPIAVNNWIKKQIKQGSTTDLVEQK